MKLGKSYSVAISGDGSYLATCNGSKVYIWALGHCSSIRDTKSVKVKNPSYLVYSPDNRSLLVKTTSGALHLVAMDTLIARKIRGASCQGPVPEFSNSGDCIIDGAWNGVVSVVSTDNGTTTWQKGWPFEGINHVLRSADKSIWLFLHTPRITHLYQPQTPCYFSQWSFPFGNGPIRLIEPGLLKLHAAALAPDAARLAVLYDGPPAKLAMIDTSDGSILAEATAHLGGTGAFLSWSPNGRVLGSVERDRVAFYANDLTELGHVSIAHPCSIAFAQDSGMIALGSWSNGCLLGASEASQVTRGYINTR